MATLVGALWGTYLLAATPPAAVELEVFVEPRAPITAAQDWLRELAAAGFTRVRIRAKQGSDQVGIEARGPDTQPVYAVTGMINSQNELVLPSGRYRLSQARQAVQWLHDLGQKGPGQRPAGAQSKGSTRLSPEQMPDLKKALAQPVAASTQDKDRLEVLQQISAEVSIPLRMGEALRTGLAGQKVTEELQGLSAGTALAYVLQSAGLCMVPSVGSAGQRELAVRSLGEGQACWPVGWPPEPPVPELLPALFESFNANLENVPVTQAMEAIGKRLKASVLWDHWAMGRHKIDPAKVLVTLPRTRITHHGLMRRVLAKAGLRYEARVDDAGRPFVWVTTVKPF